MAATLQQVLIRIDLLETALATGQMRVTHEGHTVEYRSLAEIERILARLEGQRDSLQGTTPTRRRQVRLKTKDGW